MPFAIFRRPKQVTRFAAGGFVDGVWVEGIAQVFTAQVSVQPTTPQDMEMLPEGRRDQQSFVLFGKQQLRPADDGDGTNADRVEIDGSTFEVIRSEAWQNGVINHYRSIVVKRSEQ